MTDLNAVAARKAPEDVTCRLAIATSRHRWSNDRLRGRQAPAPTRMSRLDRFALGGRQRSMATDGGACIPRQWEQIEKTDRGNHRHPQERQPKGGGRDCVPLGGEADRADAY